RGLQAGEPFDATRLERRFRAGASRYLSVVGPGAADHLPQYLDDAELGAQVRVVSDEVVAAAHGERLLAALRAAGRQPSLLALPAGEAAKTMATAERVYDWLVEQRAERGDVLVALGGGVIGDIAGFVA